MLPSLPPWTPLAKKTFFSISLMYMEIIVFILKVLSLMIKKIKCLSPLQTPLAKKYFFINNFDLYGNFGIQVQTSCLKNIKAKYHKKNFGIFWADSNLLIWA